MKLRLVVVTALLAATGVAGDWQRQLSPVEPGSFPLPRPLHLSYKFGWSVLPAGEAEANFTRTEAGLLRMDVKGKTIGLVRTLWRMNAEGVSLCRPVTLRPVSVVQTEFYKEKTVKTQLEFDDTGVAQTRWTKNGQRVKSKRFDFPKLFDMPTALLWLRSQRLQPGETYRCVVYPETSAYLAEMEVVAREKCDAAGKRDAIKVALRLQEVDRQLELVPHKKFKSAIAWFSDDSDRLLLKMTAEVFVGSVWMELDKVEFRSGSG